MVITNIFENGKVNKDTQDELFRAMTLLADVNTVLRGLEDAFLILLLRLRNWRQFLKHFAKDISQTKIMNASKPI